jgi:hypothetical protein
MESLDATVDLVLSANVGSVLSVQHYPNCSGLASHRTCNAEYYGNARCRWLA